MLCIGFSSHSFARQAQCQIFKFPLSLAGHPNGMLSQGKETEGAKALSWQAVTWVLENSEATLGSRLVLLSIASHANREGLNAFPAIDTIGKETLLGRREIIYALQSLEELGELRIQRGIGRGNPNKYELPRVLPWLEKVQTLHLLPDGKGAPKRLKGAISARKGAISTEKQVSSIAESSKCETERLEPSKALTVKHLFSSFIPEPSKPKSQEEIRQMVAQQKQILKERGFLQ